MAVDGLVVEMRGICKSFGGVEVLHDVHLELRQEILGLVGKNGAGKSTLMKVLFGVEKADRGTIKVLGAEYAPTKAGLTRGREIAMIFQEFSLIPTLTVAENVFLAHLHKNWAGLVDRDRCRGEARAILESLHVDIDPEARVDALSVSERQCVEIAKALSEHKRVLIMDEPSASLSADQVDFLFALIRKLKAQGISIVYISHNLRQVFDICDRIAVIRNGRNVLFTDVADTDLPTVIAGITGVEQLRVQRQVSEASSVGSASTDREPLLRIEALSYRNKVHGVSLSVYPGEVVGIAGLAGSGRTELLETIFGAEPRDGGRILLRGNAVRDHSPNSALKNRVVLIPDDRQVKGLISEHSVKHNIGLPILDKLRSGLFLSAKLGNRIAAGMVDQLSIVTRSLDQRVSHLSGGNQQKVVLSKAITTESQVLLLDDPTVGVDVESKQEIARTIREYVRSGERGAIVVSSEFEILSEVCDRILVMREGRIIEELSKASGDDMSESNLLTLV